MSDAVRLKHQEVVVMLAAVCGRPGSRWKLSNTRDDIVKVHNARVKSRKSRPVAIMTSADSKDRC